MSDAKILIVEDEGIEALDMQYRLVGLGYPTPEIAFSGEEAVSKAEEMRPDLVLMDIMLRGEMDGVMAASEIQARFDVPIIYITAYADEDTLQRAKITEPYAYIVKPYKERELHITIDVALYKHKMEKKLKENEKWLATTLRSIGDAVIATDANGLITFMNPVAENLMGWKLEEVLGIKLTDVFNIVNRDTRLPAENPVARVLSEGVTAGLANHTILIARDGTEVPIDDSAAPIKDDNGNMMGVILVFKDITEREKSEAELRDARAKADERAALLDGFISSMADGALLTDAEGNVVFANEALRQLLGAPPDEDYVDLLDRYKRYTMDGRLLTKEESSIMQSLKGKVVEDMRLRIVNPRGGETTVSVSSAPIYDPKGNIIAATSVLRDVSKRVEFEQKTRELYERERRIAEVLQGTLIPHDIPAEMYGCKLAVKYQPALSEAEIGGDFYDVFDLGNGRIGAVIGDVVGKGLAAAVRVAAARYTLRSYAYQGFEPYEVMRLTNETLARGKFDEASLLTMFFAVIDTGCNQITYSNAGHEPPVVINSQARCEELGVSGIPIGIMEGTTYTQGCRTLHHGDKIVMITDGIPEARSDNVVLFEKRGVIEYLTENYTATPEELTDGLLNTAIMHANGHLQDDAAVVVFEHVGIKAEGRH